jgi:hypothetical protein
MPDIEKQKYAVKRTVDRIDQALNYLRDAVEYLARAKQELSPNLCAVCAKEAGFNKNNQFWCAEHIPPDIIKPEDKVEIKEAK